MGLGLQTRGWEWDGVYKPRVVCGIGLGMGLGLAGHKPVVIVGLGLQNGLGVGLVLQTRGRCGTGSTKWVGCGTGATNQG